MTTQETIAIDTLPASRELDALVAEKLGICLHPQSKRSRDGVPNFKSANILRCVCGHFLHKDSERFEPPPYSTSIAAAWDVIERLELAPIGLSSRIGDSWRLVKTFQGDFRLDVMTPGGIVEGPEADTAPLAICRAALKAVGC